jgi:hypothetical protein
VNEVSDHAVALLLDWARGTVALDRDVKAGGWNPAGAKLRRVSDLTIGIVGYGRIGRRTAAKLQAFGCRLLVHDRKALVADGDVESLSLEGLLARSDAIILHVPLTTATHHLIDAPRLALMRPGAFLINVSRGPLVDNEALLAALQSGRLSGAGLDVVEGEPKPPRALIERPDVVVTPHVAFSSDASLIELPAPLGRGSRARARGRAPAPSVQPTGRAHVTATTIQRIHARQILDSRGRPTVEAEIALAWRDRRACLSSIGRIDGQSRGRRAPRWRERLGRPGCNPCGRECSPPHCRAPAGSGRARSIAARRAHARGGRHAEPGSTGSKCDARRKPRVRSGCRDRPRPASLSSLRRSVR